MSEFSRFPVKALVCAALVSVISLPVAAEPLSGHSLSLRAGAGEHYQRYELAWESPALLTWKLEGNNSRVDVLAEVNGSWWNSSGSRQPSSVWQMGAAPFLRWSINDAFYLEAGLSANYFSRARFADKQMSTRFQFGEHLGFGAYIGEK
ncbi:MAG: acyloxyacyl hydrolase, partial [Pusillimonas sp.]